MTVLVIGDARLRAIIRALERAGRAIDAALLDWHEAMRLLVERIHTATRRKDPRIDEPLEELRLDLLTPPGDVPATYWPPADTGRAAVRARSAAEARRARARSAPITDRCDRRPRASHRRRGRIDDG